MRDDDRVGDEFAVEDMRGAEVDDYVEEEEDVDQEVDDVQPLRRHAPTDRKGWERAASSAAGQRWWAAAVGSGGGQRRWAAAVGSGGGQRRGSSGPCAPAARVARGARRSYSR